MSLSHQIDTIVADAIEHRVFPGAVVLIANDTGTLHYAAYGATMYDTPEARPVRHDTIYDVASLTKVFTSTAALRLADAGRLDLRAPVASYLPEFRWPSVAIWHLLTHTSGLDIRLSALRHAGPAGLFEAVYQAGLLYPPGARVAYTNVNALLLGEVVARLHGAPLDLALRDLVIEPLGLRDTLFCPPAALLPRIAPTEIDQEWRGGLVHGSVHDESAHALGGVAGHAGLFSTVEDLYGYCRAWLRSLDGETGRQGEGRDRSLGPLLKSETARLATANHTPGLNAACGLGWMLDRPNFMGAAPPGSFGHTGFTGPAIAIVPQRRLVVVMLSNRVYPRRGQPDHHLVTAAIVNAALQH
jgi:CubicO group peptidase (beta-lactamase class C family)